MRHNWTILVDKVQKLWAFQEVSVLCVCSLLLWDILSEYIHNENTPIQIYRKLHL